MGQVGLGGVGWGAVDVGTVSAKYVVYKYTYINTCQYQIYAEQVMDLFSASPSHVQPFSIIPNEKSIRIQRTVD